MQETITLQNSKALHAICKEKSVVMKESGYYWQNLRYTDGTPAEYKLCSEEEAVRNRTFNECVENEYPAYTSTELLEWLKNKNICLERDIEKGVAKWFAHTYDYGKFGDTPQDALCLLLIELIENGIIN